jgi:hypothetical protein
MGMNTRTLLTVLAVVAFAFVATNCFAAKADVNKPGDANKPAEKKATISVVDFSKYTEAEKSKGCDKDPNKGKGCDKDANKATIINASDFGTLAKKADKPADANKPAEPNKTKLATIEKGIRSKGLHKRDPNKPADANKPAEPNKATIISASNFGT